MRTEDVGAHAFALFLVAVYAIAGVVVWWLVTRWLVDGWGMYEPPALAVGLLACIAVVAGLLVCTAMVVDVALKDKKGGGR